MTLLFLLSDPLNRQFILYYKHLNMISDTMERHVSETEIIRCSRRTGVRLLMDLLWIHLVLDHVPREQLFPIIHLLEFPTVGTRLFGRQPLRTPWSRISKVNLSPV